MYHTECGKPNVEETALTVKDDEETQGLCEKFKTTLDEIGSFNIPDLCPGCMRLDMLNSVNYCVKCWKGRRI